VNTNFLLHASYCAYSNGGLKGIKTIYMYNNILNRMQYAIYTVVQKIKTELSSASHTRLSLYNVQQKTTMEFVFNLRCFSLSLPVYNI